MIIFKINVKRLNLMRSVAGNAWGCNKRALYTIYKSLMRSLLDYGCKAFDSACNSLKEILSVIRAKNLRICCGAFITTSISFLQVNCGEAPLQLRRQQQLVKYSVKIKSIENVTRFFCRITGLPIGENSIKIHSKF